MDMEKKNLRHSYICLGLFARIEFGLLLLLMLLYRTNGCFYFLDIIIS